MVFDIIGSVLKTAVTLGDIGNKEMLYQTLGVPI